MRNWYYSPCSRLVLHKARLKTACACLSLPGMAVALSRTVNCNPRISLCLILRRHSSDLETQTLALIILLFLATKEAGQQYTMSSGWTKSARPMLKPRGGYQKTKPGGSPAILAEATRSRPTTAFKATAPISNPRFAQRHFT